MPWLRIEESFTSHPKVIDLSDAAFRTHMSALTHCARNLTDGFVSENAARQCYPRPNKAFVTELVKSGLWARTTGGYTIHDYLEYNPTRAQVLSDRKKAKDRMAYVRANITRTSEEPNLPRTPSPYPLRSSTSFQETRENATGRTGMRRIGEILR